MLYLQRQSGNAAVTRLLQRAPADRPASTDVADAAGVKPAPNGGGEPIHARVIGVSVDGGATRITIASGTDQGIAVGMPGALLDPSGSPYVDFKVEDAAERISHAHVRATVDEVEAAGQVVVGENVVPTPRRPTADIRARVLATSVVEGAARITIGSGRQQGVEVGMSGSLLGPDGKETADFTIDEVEFRLARANVPATFDQVKTSTDVVIKAASFTPENMDDKQF